MADQNKTCDHCGIDPPEGLTLWRTEETVRPPRHYLPPSRSQAFAANAIETPATPTLRNAYATRIYSLCPACYAAAKQAADHALAGQKRGMAVVAIIGAIGLLWIMITAFIHSDLLGRPLTDAKAWIFTAPAPTPYKEPLNSLPAAQ